MGIRVWSTGLARELGIEIGGDGSPRIGPKPGGCFEPAPRSDVCPGYHARMNPRSTEIEASSAAPARRHSDVRTITLVGLAHGSSHFCHLLLPPLFPFFIRDFGLSYAE